MSFTRDWFQLTLKEGLTVFRDQTFSGDMGSHAVKRIEVRPTSFSGNTMLYPTWWCCRGLGDEMLFQPSATRAIFAVADTFF